MKIYLPTGEIRPPKMNEFYHGNKIMHGVLKAQFDHLEGDKEIYQEIEINKSDLKLILDFFK